MEPHISNICLPMIVGKKACYKKKFGSSHSFFRQSRTTTQFATENNNNNKNNCNNITKYIGGLSDTSYFAKDLHAHVFYIDVHAHVHTVHHWKYYLNNFIYFESNCVNKLNILPSTFTNCSRTIYVHKASIFHVRARVRTAHVCVHCAQPVLGQYRQQLLWLVSLRYAFVRSSYLLGGGRSICMLEYK